MSSPLPKIKPFAKGPGLTVGTYFTEGLSGPYEGVVFRKVDAVILDWETKAETFHQNGFEVTAEHTDTDAAVIASKYARGTLGTPERETSIKQIVGRVVDKITNWGVKGGYFATNKDSLNFHEELTRILITRKAAFNSPVWFNLGVAGVKQQASACMPYGVRVNTNRGMIPIGDVVRMVREGVPLSTYDKDGAQTKIMHGVCNGKRAVTSYEFDNGMSLRMTGNHVVFVQDGGKVVEKKADDLLIGDDLILSRALLVPSMDSVQVGTWTVDKDLAWIAGMMVGDGYCGHPNTSNSPIWEIKINTMSEKVLMEKILTRYQIPFTAYPFHWGWTMRGYGQAGKAFWTALGLWDKTHNKIIPEWVYGSGALLMSAFIRGLFDSDGTVVAASSNDRVIVQLSNTSEDVIDGCHKMLSSMGIFATKSAYVDGRTEHTRKISYTLSINDVQSVAIFDGQVGFTHEKKAALLQGRNKNVPGYKTSTLTLVGKKRSGYELVYDIQTESSTFWAEGILVHNCFTLGLDDDMESILDHAKIQGMIFKGGSGAGANVSRLRSRREAMSGGGRASGPLSFMSGFDKFAGVIKSGGKTRRAALLRVMNEDHPDIRDYIWCKVVEEKKAAALIAGGFSGGFEGEAYSTVDYQNANNTCKVSDRTMAALKYEREHVIQLRAITTGKVLDTISAKDLMTQIADAAWQCGDPGLHFDAIERCNKVPSLGKIWTSNPCSEFVHIDDTSCNLASMNLREFQNEDGTLDVEAYQAAIRILILAMEIIVDNAHYPTERIKHMTRLTRPLGLGYCNLGAFLMAAGLPYDSREARTLAFGITSLLTATAYHRSAEIARDHGGPFTAYQANREIMLGILETYAQSATQSGKIRSHVHTMDEVLAGVLEQTWAEALDLGRIHGYRNDETTCLAPTGTIQFFMTADTTGCEPDIALVKYKTLAGGGTLKIVNKTVAAALRKLGYTHEQAQSTITFVDAHDTIEGAPGLKSEHLPVFDCAFKAQNGTRFISWQGHVEMMAALQEGVSMAISKTVNMPNSATREDVLSAYTLAWDLGVKALAVFRDGSKGVQVVSTGTGGDKAETDPPTLAPRATRTMSGSRTKIGIGGMDGYVRTSHDADGRIVEVFLTFSKHGSTVGGLMDALAVMISKDLRRGVSLGEILDSIRWGSFVPQGWTTIETSDGKSENMPSSSIVNAVCTWLMAEYPDGVWVGKGKTLDMDAVANVATAIKETMAKTTADGPAPKFCNNCGGVKVPNGPRCWTCLGCGDKEGGCG